MSQKVKPPINYWLNQYTAKTWKEFQAAGSGVTGLLGNKWSRAQKVNPGDVFLCYLIGAKRWVGALQVRENAYRDHSPIFEGEPFPVRFKVRPIVLLEPEQGVSMDSLLGELSFYRSKPLDGRRWSVRVRIALTKYSDADGNTILGAVQEAGKAARRRRR